MMTVYLIQRHSSRQRRCRSNDTRKNNKTILVGVGDTVCSRNNQTDKIHVSIALHTGSNTDRIIKPRRIRMIKIDNIEVYNILPAILGIRNAMKSWDKSDSIGEEGMSYIIGEKDKELALKLVKAGTDHRKFLRQIFVSMNITAPLYWWKEMDTYKVGTTANSESTMHTLTNRLLTKDDFSWDSLTDYRHSTLNHLNDLIDAYQRTGNKIYWRELIQDLPSSFNQMRTWTANYEVMRNIYHARKNHKLVEWQEFCDAIAKSLPHSELITEVVYKIKNQEE